jgi:hypothetical protein
MLGKSIYNNRFLIIAHVVIFTLFIIMLPKKTITGLERIIATYLMVLLISYGITLNWNKSAIISLVFLFLAGLLDGEGVFNDWKVLFGKPKEPFDNKDDDLDIKPAGDSIGKIPEASTLEKDDTGLSADDLDTILATDRENEERGDVAQKKLFDEAGGGLEGLSKLLKQAREESPDGKEKTAEDHTPAQAQRKTHQLIDTMKQLKVTMEEMTPIMKQGSQIMNLYNKLGGKDIMKAFK